MYTIISLYMQIVTYYNSQTSRLYIVFLFLVISILVMAFQGTLFMQPSVAQWWGLGAYSPPCNTNDLSINTKFIKI